MRGYIYKIYQDRNQRKLSNKRYHLRIVNKANYVDERVNEEKGGDRKYSVLVKMGSITPRKNRCVHTGYPRSVQRFTRIQGYSMRHRARQGKIPGISKASW